MELKVDLRQEGEKLFVDLQGDLDINSNKEFKEKVNSVQGVKKITVNCENLSYIDSTGIGVLVGIAHRAQEIQVVFVVAHPQKNVARVFDLLGVTEDLNVREND